MATTITYKNTFLVITMNDKSYIVDNRFTASKEGELVIITENTEHPEIKLEWTDIVGELSSIGLFNKLVAWKETVSSGGGGTIADAEYKSPIDFSTQRYSASQLTLSNLNIPIVNSSQLKYIIKTNSANTETEVLTNGSGSVSLIWDATNSRIDVKKNGVAYPLFNIGVGLTITTTVTAGVITGGTIIAGGTGYYSGGTVLVAGGTGGYFTVTATNGVVTGITLSAGGSGYTTAVAAATSMYSYALDVATVVGIDGQEKGYDSITNAFINFMNNYPVQPLHNVLIAPSTSVITDSWFPSKDGLDVGFHKRHVFTGILAPAASQVLTMSIEGTNADDLTVDANWTALDFYNVVGLATVNTLATAAGTSTSFNIRIQDCGYRNIRYRITPSINTNANTCNCYLNSTY